MSTFEKYMAGAFSLIAIYLLVQNANNTNTVLTALSQANTSAIRALQGRG